MSAAGIIAALLGCLALLIYGAILGLRRVTPVRKITNTGAHTARALRDTEDSKTITWLKTLNTRRRPPAIEVTIAIDDQMSDELERLRKNFQDAVAKGGHPVVLADVDPWASLPNAAAGNWQPADRPWLTRPDMEDTGAIPALIDWALHAPLSEVRRG